MDHLAEKKRKLEAIRAAREAKKRVVDQYRMSKAHLPSSPVDPLSKSLTDSSLSYPERSTSVLAESMTSSTVRNPKTDKAVEPQLAEIAAPSLDSVDSAKQNQVECSNDAKPMSTKTPPVSPGALARSNSGRDSTSKGESTQAASQCQPSKGIDSPQLVSRVSPETEKPTNSHSYSQCFDCFRHLGGLESSDCGNASTRVAEVCALTPKICLGDEDRLVVDIAVIALPYKGGSTASGRTLDSGLPGGLEKSTTQQGTTAPPSTPFVDTVPCVAVAYAALSVSTIMQDASSIVGEAAATTVNGRPMEDLPMILRSSYPWGHLFSTSVRPNAASTLAALEAVSAQVRQTPGLVLVWTVIPGTGPVEATTQDSSRDGVAAPVEADSQDLVVLTPLVCDAEVTTLIAHPFSPPGVFIAGTASGRLVMWHIAASEWFGLDRKQLRARALTSTGSASVLVGNVLRPSASSFPSPQLHQGRVLALAVHGNVSNHYLYSISQEGRVCTWQGWQTLQPIVARSAYFEGGVFMGNVGTVAVFAGQRGSDSMTRVYIGTSDGAVIEGFNRNDRTIELHRCGVGKKADGYTGPSLLERNSGTLSCNKNVSDVRGTKVAASLVPSAVPSSGIPEAPVDTSGAMAFRSARDRGRVIAMALQPPPTHVSFRDHDCVVVAFAHGSCVAYMGDTSIVMDGFVSMVTALRWSPTHAGIFAAGDAEGVVSLWDVYYSFSVPLLSVRLDQASAGLGYGSSSGIEAVVVVMKGRGTLGSSLDAGVGCTMRMASTSHAPPIRSAMDGTTEAVTSLTFSADGRWLFSGVTVGDVYVLELSEEVVRLERGL
ncbi:unnamed protein product [Phytomonas sp. EM1]|nr:unnamed protein product [Phytomonas sp. EM1]|eukprot:CCW64266.1 unnamed protein product [Phytomonas sp. isolate EM1]